MAVICDSVILSRPPLILISHGGLTDSDEEQEKHAALTVSLTLLLLKASNQTGEGIEGAAIDLPVFFFFFFWQKVSAQRQTHIFRSRHTHALTLIMSNEVRWPR